jgi:hypothetical protein
MAKTHAVKDENFETSQIVPARLQKHGRATHCSVARKYDSKYVASKFLAACVGTASFMLM